MVSADLISESGNKDARQNPFMGQSMNRSEVFIAECDLSQSLLKRAEQIATQDGPLLIRGGAGSGKTHLTRHIHRLSERSDGPLLVRRCGELDAVKMEDDLFEAGGLVARARGGILVLEGIHQLSPRAQYRLTRFLDEQEFDDNEADVRLIATTAVELCDHVRESSFLIDLWHHLRRWRLKIPSLNERPKDIPALARYFLTCFCERTAGFCQENDWFFSKEVLYLFGQMPWHGNVRELRDAVENIALFADGDHSPISLKAAADSLFDQDYHFRSSERKPPANAVEHLYHVLATVGWNISLASRITGVSRAKIHDHIEEEGWNIPQQLQE